MSRASTFLGLGYLLPVHFRRDSMATCSWWMLTFMCMHGERPIWFLEQPNQLKRAQFVSEWWGKAAQDPADTSDLVPTAPDLYILDPSWLCRWSCPVFAIVEDAVLQLSFSAQKIGPCFCCISLNCNCGRFLINYGCINSQESETLILEALCVSQWPGRVLGITGWDPSVCKSNRLHDDILRFS